MRIAPVMLQYGNKNAIATKGTSLNRQKAPSASGYTGNASYDLALASTRDSNIASELSKMGLIYA